VLAKIIDKAVVPNYVLDHTKRDKNIIDRKIEVVDGLNENKDRRNNEEAAAQ
jgi:hypothetical protein